MYLLVILAFAMIFWRSDTSANPFITDGGGPFATMAIAWLPTVMLVTLAGWFSQRGLYRLRQEAGAPEAVQLFHHRTSSALRGLLLLAFAVTVFGTDWPRWFAFGSIHPTLQIIGDVLTLSPFLLGVIALFTAAFPLERALRQLASGENHADTNDGVNANLRHYLDFHIRHQLLVTMVPMLLILFAANMIDAYEVSLTRWGRSAWAPDVALTLVAAGVFFLSPLLLIRIWKTRPLPDGPVRLLLEDTCRRIHLRCRDILVWPSDGMMVNAAVMGLLAPVRYVLLSDGLLATMTPRQIEAVFGHEAGHVRHHHIPHFLIFATAAWVVVTGLMEVLARLSASGGAAWLSPDLIRVTGIMLTILVWGVGFGSLSRRFERQADLFGARCVAPPEPQGCFTPCSVHGGAPGVANMHDRVCATGAAVFASALDTVALLNGIPHEERSWRHSSIGSRIRFLASLAGDPARAVRFEQHLARIKTFMLAVAITGSALWLYYGLTVPDPLILKL